ncbi:MAG: hypothetical protein HGA35_00350 [Erysipelotrichaceae bacterium]|nr:hypothetical protein [Erysipelotrichaceae bacterium]
MRVRSTKQEKQDIINTISISRQYGSIQVKTFNETHYYPNWYQNNKHSIEDFIKLPKYKRLINKSTLLYSKALTSLTHSIRCCCQNCNDTSIFKEYEKLKAEVMRININNKILLDQIEHKKEILNQLPFHPLCIKSIFDLYDNSEDAFEYINTIKLA